MMYNAKPKEKNMFVIRGGLFIFIDDDGHTTCRGHINFDGSQITFAETNGFGCWQKLGEYEPVTIGVNDFPLGLYECVVSIDGIQRGARHYVTQVRVDSYKIYGLLDDGKGTR